MSENELPHGLTVDDLPAWMRKTRREVDWGFWGVVVLTLIILWPLVTRSGLPYTPSMRAELARTVEMAEGIQAGIVYPRWAPDFNYGFGSPLWNYLAPLPHYLTGLHYVLAQDSPETSVKAIFIVAALLNGLGMYGFVRRRWGDHAALLSAAVYLYSPQMILVTPYLEGDLALWLAMGFFVVTLWALDRLLRDRRGWDIVLAALASMGIWLSDTPLNLVLMAIILGWLVVAGRRPRGAWLKGVLALGLGCGMSAFYWLPAWSEWSAVRWLAAADRPLAQWHTFTLSDLLQMPGRIDLQAANPRQTAALGLAAWTLALLALGAVLVSSWRRTSVEHSTPIARGEVFQRRVVAMLHRIPPEQWKVGYFVGVGALLVFVVLPPSYVLWTHLPEWPPLAPRDLLPIVAACCAIAAGQIGVLLGHVRRRALLWAGMVICLAYVLLPALFTLPLPVWPERSLPVDVTAILRDETRGHAVSSLMTGWLLPKTVSGVPQPSAPLVISYQNGAVDRIVRSSLPAAVQMDLVAHNAQSQRYVVRAPYAFDLTLQLFDFPGWKVEIEGAIVPHTTDRSGLIALTLPEGQYEVLVHFGSTPPRTVGWIVSVVACGGMLAAWWVMRRALRSDPEQGAGEEGYSPAASLHPAVVWAVVVMFGLGAAAVEQAPERFADSSPRGVVDDAEQQLPRSLGGVDFLAFTVEQEGTVHPGDRLTVDLFWRAGRPDLPDYQATLAVVSIADPANQIAFVRHRHPGLIPTSQWLLWPLLDYYVRDSYDLEIDPAAAPGVYAVVVQLGRCSQVDLLPCDRIEPLFVRDGRGSRLGQEIVLPVTIQVGS